MSPRYVTGNMLCLGTTQKNDTEITWTCRNVSMLMRLDPFCTAILIRPFAISCAVGSMSMPIRVCSSGCSATMAAEWPPAPKVPSTKTLSCWSLKQASTCAITMAVDQGSALSHGTERETACVCPTCVFPPHQGARECVAQPISTYYLKPLSRFLSAPRACQPLSCCYLRAQWLVHAIQVLAG